MKIKATKSDAYNLFHDGTLALAEIERNGIRVDVGLLDKQITKTEERVKSGLAWLRDHEYYQTWKRAYGKKTNLNSKPQLAHVIFDKLGFERNKGGGKQDELAFANVNDKFVANYFKIEKLKKLSNTYLTNIKNELGRDDRLHPFFNLHNVKTYRSSSDRINFQNLPSRNPVQVKIIKNLFIPSDGNHLVEIDYSALEFTMAGSVTTDPEIKRYIVEGGDPHRDMAALVFACEPDEVTKVMRQETKNKFVFPILYGSWWKSCAPSLWEVAQNTEFKGKPLVEHLKTQGIERLGDLDNNKPEPGTFLYHMAQCEKIYTKEKFRRCFAVQEAAYKYYRENGEVKFTTGFTASGVMSRNDVYNWRIQGPAFHCLLWAIIRIEKTLRKKKMRSLIVGQIHDSIIADVRPNELEDYLKISNYYMTKAIRKEWKWLSVPMAIEAEVTPIDTPWTQKQVMEIPE